MTACTTAAAAAGRLYRCCVAGGSCPAPTRCAQHATALCSEEDIGEIQREIAMLKQCQNPNITQ